VSLLQRFLTRLKDLRILFTLAVSALCRINESLQGVKEEIVSGISSAIEASVGESLIGCMFRNSCTDSAFAALRCFNSLCADEFAQAGQSIGDIRDCVDSERATPLGCVLGATVPDGVIDAAQRLQIIAELIPSIVEGLSDAKGIIVEASQNFPVPGNVILVRPEASAYII
jgi:hypothetical protein